MNNFNVRYKKYVYYFLWCYIWEDRRIVVYVVMYVIGIIEDIGVIFCFCVYGVVLFFFFDEKLKMCGKLSSKFIKIWKFYKVCLLNYNI